MSTLRPVPGKAFQEQGNTLNDRWVYRDDWGEPYDIEKHRRERADNGYSTFDWWNFDGFIAEIVSTSAERFRVHGVGYPAHIGEHEWKAICYRIALHLEAYVIMQHNPDINRVQATVIHNNAVMAMKLFAENFVSFWD